MFGVVPKMLWEKKFPADEKNRVSLATNCLLVRGKDFTAVVESGIGEKWDEKAREIYAIEHETTLSRALAAHGVHPENVDALVLSHLHFDHAGGATRRENGRVVATFRNATFYVQKAELDHARSPNERDRASYLPENWEPYAEAGRLEATPTVGQKVSRRRRPTPIAARSTWRARSCASTHETDTRISILRSALPRRAMPVKRSPDAVTRTRSMSVLGRSGQGPS